MVMYRFNPGRDSIIQIIGMYISKITVRLQAGNQQLALTYNQLNDQDLKKVLESYPEEATLDDYTSMLNKYKEQSVISHQKFLQKNKFSSPV